MKTDIVDPIATTCFSLVRSDGARSRLTVLVGRPYIVDESESRCPVKLEGLEPQYPDICGSDTFQALCLALRLVRRRLEDQLDRGHRLSDISDGVSYDKGVLATLYGTD